MSARLAVALLAALLGLGACERSVRNMYEQPRRDPGEASALFPDGKASRLPPAGGVLHAMGDLAATSSGREGLAAAEARDAAYRQPALPARPDRDQLLRGQERYRIYCLPCHSPVGDGDGPVVRHGFPHPPSFHAPRLRDAPDRHFFDVITQGYGVMYPYADRVSAQDRWAIVAYIRALQRHPPAPAAPASTPASTPGATG